MRGIVLALALVSTLGVTMPLLAAAELPGASPAEPAPEMPPALPTGMPAEVEAAAGLNAKAAAEPDAHEDVPPAQGQASFYAKRFHGRRTASGEPHDAQALTAAHRSLPFGTWVRVQSLHSGREVSVRINDRGPFVQGRIIDLSRAAAEALGMLQAGTHAVTLQVLGLPKP